MAWTSIFSPKKVTPTNKKSPIQNISASISNIGAYTPPMYAANVAKNAVSAFTGRFDKQQPQMSVAPKQPQMSVAPKQPLQGSGMSSQYASNPQNYQAKPQTPTTQQQTQPSQPSASEKYISTIDNQSKQQQAVAEQRRKQQEDFLRKNYALANEQLQSQLPGARQQFEQMKSGTEQTIADLLAGGERQKGQARDYYGEAQRLAAQTARETQGQTQRTFANLGTLDSRGEGSFGQATENQQSEFNRYTQQNLKAQADKLSEIDAQVGAAERQARQVITQESQKLADFERQIQFALANNKLQEAQDIANAYNETQDYIAQIQDGVANMKYQFELEREKLGSALTGLEGLSEEFLSTGKPVTDQDKAFIYSKAKTPKDLQDIQSLFGGQSGQSQEKQKITSVVDTLLNSDLGAISGMAGFRKPALGSGAAMTSNYAKQLMGLLSLENRLKLKGQGAITDREMGMLDRAASALGIDESGTSNLNEDQIRQLLEELRSELSGQPSLASILG